MPSRKRVPSKRGAAGRHERAPSATSRGRMELLLENILAQNAATIEAVQAFRGELLAKIDDVDVRLTGRMDGIESAVRHSTTEIQRVEKTLVVEIQRLDGRIDQVGGKIDQVESRIDRVEGKIDQVESKLDRVEGRIDRVEGKLDQVEGKLDRVEGRIDQVEGKIDQVERRLTTRLDSLADDVHRVETKLDSKAAAATVAALEGRVSVLEQRAVS
jgi:chromosome segregation ATPase